MAHNFVYSFYTYMRVALQKYFEMLELQKTYVISLFEKAR